MPLTVGEDTFGSLADADEYADARPYFAEWKDVATTDEQKEQALRMAAVQLSSMYEWLGNISDLEQLMPWPRENVVDNEGREIPDDAIPIGIVYAQFELAYQWLVADQLTPNPTIYTSVDAGLQLKRRKLGELEQEYFQQNSYLYDLSEGKLKEKVYPLVDIYVKPYISRKVGSIFVPSSF